MDAITKEDLEILRQKIVKQIELILDNKLESAESLGGFDWLRSKAIRKMMDISPATLQNFRIKGKIRYKKVMGSYYYNKADLLKLFEDEN